MFLFCVYFYKNPVVIESKRTFITEMRIFIVKMFATR